MIRSINQHAHDKTWMVKRLIHEQESGDRIHPAPLHTVMFQIITSLLSSPSKPDEEQDRVARWLHYILLGGMAGSFLITVSAYISQAPNSYRISVPFLIFATVAYVINKLGFTNTATFLFLIFLVGTVTYATLTSNGIHDTVVILYSVTLVVGGLILSQRFYWSLVIVTLLSVGGVVYVESRGLIVTPFSELTDFTDFVLVSSILLVQAFTVNLLINNLMRALKNARQENLERMLAKERESRRRVMMEKVVHIGKSVTEQTSDIRTALFKIWNGVRNGLDFDRTAVFLYDPENGTMQGSYGTSRSGEMSEEWGMKFSIDTDSSFFRIVLSQSDGYYFTEDYAGERNLSQRPGHPMEGVKHYAAVAVWAGNKPMAIICVDQLTSARAITAEQLEALRLFAGYAGLAIENARLSAELAERAQELGNRNAELERFTYTVSHDLRSPLVTIKGFLGMLNRDLLENRTERAADDMQRIAGATDKMDALLSDLLELSRIGRLINPPEEVDSARLIQDALDSVDGRLRSKNVTVNIKPDLPTLYGDRIRLREVFENLIDNAAKYMGNQSAPVIEIGAEQKDGECAFYVKDNGMGIDPAYQTRIFSLFEKLNPTSEGTGIGLTLVKRIIETHGGKIWVESEGEGMGSVFWFTLAVK
jgi:signal transduction histidine kinase